ncbi:MAG: hypothetical protein K6G04_00470 [Lachnospiraceae bacterium]|nr:hypothetical protein [Lachnospiraceae bacterium]
MDKVMKEQFNQLTAVVGSTQEMLVDLEKVVRTEERRQRRCINPLDETFQTREIHTTEVIINRLDGIVDNVEFATSILEEIVCAS